MYNFLTYIITKETNILDSRFNSSNSYHGTTTVGVVCKDGIIFCTDSRVTMGRFIAHRKGRKVYQIDGHLAMTVAGTVADAQNVVDILRYYAKIYKLERNIPIPIKTAARLVSNVFFSARLFPYITNVLVGGYDINGANIFNVELFGSLIEEKYASTGSGSPIAYGILEDEYYENISINEGMVLAVKAVLSAMRRDAMSGDYFNVVMIDKNGYKELSDIEKKEVSKNIFG